MMRLIRISASSWIVLLVLILIQEVSPANANSYSRADFPSYFIFGASTSAYQVEGALTEDGRTPSVLDNYTFAGHSDGSNPDIACDGYHKYKEDVKLMAETGLDAYRFSISWSRLIPNGRGPVNPKGLEYYNNLINELLSHGIEPHVVLLHWDLPQALWDDYGERISRKFVKDFTSYADVCFRNFGDRVLHWTTINEANLLPRHFCFIPGFDSSCKSSTGPYISGHNLLLAHASTVKLYKMKYQKSQQGYIGLNVYDSWYSPETTSKEDVLAARRAKDFMTGWFIEPLVFGDYPEIMKKTLGSRLPSLTQQESKLMKGAFDFIAINCYTASSVKDASNIPVTRYFQDMAVTIQYLNIGGTVIQRVLEDFIQYYRNPPIYIHENGYRMKRNTTLNDTPRIQYLSSAIGSLLDAVRNGSDARGYFVWSFLDVLEMFADDSWAFGLYFVDRDDPNLNRYPKSSAYWYSSFLEEKTSLNLIKTS